MKKELKNTTKKIIAGILILSAFTLPNLKAFAKNSRTLNTNTVQKAEKFPIIKFLTEAKISKAQEKAFAITNEMASTCPDHTIISQEVSSDRYYYAAKPTDLESDLDEAVKSGDLPIQNFTMEDLQKAKDSLNLNPEKNAKFLIEENFDAIKLHEKENCSDGDIVNLASQFNALESVSNRPTAVKYWAYDRTQGPYCALQSVAGTKHREAAHLQGKLADALADMLKNCKINGKPITEKYPELYKGGYLELMEITSEKDMETFLSFLEDENNLKNMKVLMQWVKCEGTGKKQLQFFTAAPSFQSYSKSIWNSNSKIMNLRKKACIKLIEIQYKAMAQAAAIISAYSGKNIKLHVCMVGHSVFNNPIETVHAALKTLKEELSGVDATVFLQNRPGYPNIWEKGNPNKLGIKWKNFKK